MTASPAAPRARRLHLLALCLLPRRFREEYGDVMTDVFAELHRDASRSAGWRGVTRLWSAELGGLARLAVLEHRAAWRDAHATRAERTDRRLHERENLGMLDSLRLDLRYALRALRRSPGFTTIAILTLALGIGANTAIFSVVHGVLLKPLSLTEPERLVALGETEDGSDPRRLDSTSPGSFFDWQRQATAFSAMSAFGLARPTVTGACAGSNCEPQSLSAVSSVGGLFDVLLARPLFGRVPVVADEQPGADAVVVLSHGAWRRMFGDDRSALGRTLTVNGRARTIIGVMPSDFRFPDGTIELWLPRQLAPEERANRDQYMFAVVGRLRPGVTLEQARADMEAVAARLRSDWAQYNTGLRINVLPLRDSFVASSVETRLLILMGAVAFVLLITCANLANLLLARASVRRREMAVRQALGAGRRRVLRQLLTESVLLALGGGVLGLAFGKVLLNVLLASQQANLPRVDDVGLDPAVLAFTLAVSAVAGLMFGIVPALQLSRPGSAEVLREGTRGTGGHRWSRNALVVAEVALAVVLLAGAGLLVRSFAMLQQVDPGFRTDRLLTFDVVQRGNRPGFFATTLEQIEALPGVRSAAVISQLPVTGRGIGAWFNMLDRPVPASETPPAEGYRVVSPGYFSTIGLPLLSGRLLSSEDRLDGSMSVVINDALARKYYRDRDPLGREVYLGAPDNRLFRSATIVGVVGDTKDGGLDVAPLPLVYIPLAMMPTWPNFSYVIRTSVDPLTVAGLARSEIRALDPALPVENVSTMENVVHRSVAPVRWSTTVLGAFAGIALVMAALGVFGVLSYMVTQRTRELGIRMALGAAPHMLRRLVIGQGMSLAAVGVVIGLAGALALTRLMSGMLFGVSATDPATFAAVCALLLGVAGLASWIPARRATRLDPMVALRSE